MIIIFLNIKIKNNDEILTIKSGMNGPKTKKVRLNKLLNLLPTN